MSTPQTMGYRAFALLAVAGAAFIASDAGAGGALAATTSTAVIETTDERTIAVTVATSPREGRSSSTNAFVPPSGTVAFTEGGSPLGTAPLVAPPQAPITFLGEVASADIENATTTTTTLATAIEVPRGGTLIRAYAASATPGITIAYPDGDTTITGAVGGGGYSNAGSTSFMSGFVGIGRALPAGSTVTLTSPIGSNLRFHLLAFSGLTGHGATVGAAGNTDSTGTPSLTSGSTYPDFLIVQQLAVFPAAAPAPDFIPTPIPEGTCRNTGTNQPDILPLGAPGKPTSYMQYCIVEGGGARTFAGTFAGGATPNWGLGLLRMARATPTPVARLKVPSGLAAGTHTVDFTYSGDAANGMSNGSITFEVFGSGLVLTSSANPVVAGNDVTFSATVSGAGSTPTGSVELRDGSIVLGTVPLAGGVASLTTSQLTAGVHDVRARYLGSAYHAPAEAGPLQQTVSGLVALDPPSANVPPRGTALFTATGGTPPYSFSLIAGGSGGTIGASGAFVAGSNGNTQDVVRVTDTLGSAATATVNVGPALAIAPASPSVAPRGTIEFSATGGGSGRTWSLTTNGSGGSIDAVTGAYTAGTSSNALDTVGVRDSLGNVASVNVSVGGALSFAPATASTPPRGSITFTAAGGAGEYKWAMLAAPSGGTVDGGGRYVAGSKGNVTDSIELRDSNGNRAAIDVAVGAPLALAPGDATVAAGGTVAFTVSGGSGTGFAFAIQPNESGGGAGAGGVYQAGSRAGTDVLHVTDSLGNTASATIVVTAAPAAPAPNVPKPAGTVSTPPDPPSTSPSTSGSDDGGCAAAPRTSTRGAGDIPLIALAAIALRRRRR